MTESIFRKDGTAQGVAKQRLIESLAIPEKRVINDPYADNFVAGSGFIKLMGHKLSVWTTKQFAPGFHEHLIARTRYIDDFIENSSLKGFEQYVILGAGYDLRAHRLKLSPSMKIFEVDQKEVQNIKRKKLPAKIKNLENITYVSVDFNSQSLRNQLINAGFDQNKSTVFTLEGVSQYIPKSALLSTIDEICELTKNTRCSFYISYVNQKLKTNTKKCFGEGYPNPEKKANMIMKLAAKVGEPWISFFSHDEMKEILSTYDLKMKQDKTLSDLNSEYFSPIGRELSENEIFNLEHSVIAEK